MTETAKWYEKAGNCGDVVISTRVRLARNLKQYPFPARATDKQREAVEQKVKDALLSGNSILSKVWGENYFGDVKIVDVNIRRLRMKIEDEPTSPAFITTIWGYGYKWEF